MSSTHISDTNYRALRAEAGRAGDIVMQVIVDKALGDLSNDPDDLDEHGQPDYSGGGHSREDLTRIRDVLYHWTITRCRAECRRVILAARTAAD